MRAAPELERERAAELVVAPKAAEPAPVVGMPEQLAALPEMQRARAVAGMPGNAVAARTLSRAGETCKCGGTIGADGQCDRCRAMRAAGLEPEGAEGAGSEADLAISRMLSAAAAARGTDGGLLL